jgi:hypothetical protein
MGQKTLLRWICGVSLLFFGASGGFCQGFGGGGFGGGGFVLRERMKRDRPTDFQLLAKVKRSEIVVVRGSYDHVETVLGFVHAPHILIDPEDLERAELNAGQLLLINCPGQISEKAIEKVRKFVNAGGFLFTTDWSLLNVIEKAFPGYVAYNKKPTTDDVVAVRVLKEDHHFLQHVQSGRGEPKWWLEGQSYPIRVLAPAKVQVLMASEEMKTKYGESPIAVTFRYGDGQVLHIVSHYYLQRTETRTKAEKEKGTEFAKELGVTLTPEAKKALEKTTAGEARDAYSASQLSANVIVAKQKMNTQLLQVYRYRATAPDTVRQSADSSASVVTKIEKGARLKVLEKRKEWWRVQTYTGDSGWVPSKSIRAEKASEEKKSSGRRNSTP